MMNSTLKTQNSKLIALVAVFVGLATLYSAIVPLGEGPDEPGHAAYVFFLAREGRLPDQRRDEVPGEGHQPPLAYGLAAPLLAWLPREQRSFDLPGNPRFTWAGGAELNAVAHGSREYWPWRGAVLAWHVLRLVSVGLGAATVMLTYLAANALHHRLQIANGRFDPERSTIDTRQSKIPLLATVLVAFNPQFLFVSALVTNDALLTALSAVLLWLVLQPARQARRPSGVLGHALLIGVVLGLALLTKQSALILVPVALLAVLERSIAAERARSPQHVVALLVCLAATLLVCGWWYQRNLRLYGDLFGLTLFQAEFATQAFDARSLAAWGSALEQLHSSFWARFGWMNVPAPAWVIGLFGLIELVAAAGWLRSMLPVGQPGRGMAGRVALAWPLLLLPLLAGAWLVSFALTAGLVAWQGRLLFPALPALAIVLALGLQLAAGKRVGMIAWLVPTAGCLLAIWLPFGVIGPAYPRQTLAEATALARLGTPIYARFGMPGDPGAELLGWQLAQPLRAGTAAELTLMWYARGRQGRDWTVFVHLVDANDVVVAEDNTKPRGGAFPMTQWVAGDWVEDRHTLVLRANLPPGAYRLRVGLFDERTQDRTAVFSRRGRLLGSHYLLSTLQVE